MGLDFDEWMLTKDKSYVPTDDSMSLRLLRECWFSRDAEVVSLTNQRDYEYVRAENAEQERDQLREQVKMLRDAATRAHRKLSAYVGVCTGDKELTNTIIPMLKEALAATEPR